MSVLQLDVVHLEVVVDPLHLDVAVVISLPARMIAETVIAIMTAESDLIDPAVPMIGKKNGDPVSLAYLLTF